MNEQTKDLTKQENTAPMLEPASMNMAEGLIAKAIDQNVSVETMEKLLAMRRELRQEAAKAAFDEALAGFQSEIGTIDKTKVVKDKYGKERYRYAPIDSIVEQVKQPLSKYGLSYTISTHCEPSQVTAICHVKHKMGHSEESSMVIPIDPKAYMNPAQKVAAANTFAKRYAFCNALGIMTGDADDDSQAAFEENEPVQEKQQAPSKNTTNKKASSNKPATEKQKRLIQDLADQIGAPKSEFVQFLKKSFSVADIHSLTARQASNLIEILLKRKEQPKEEKPKNDDDDMNDLPPVVEVTVEDIDESIAESDDEMTTEEAVEALRGKDDQMSDAAKQMMKGGYNPPKRA